LADVTSLTGYDNLGRGQPVVFKKNTQSPERAVKKIAEDLELFSVTTTTFSRAIL
jgi:hypothetical protein